MGDLSPHFDLSEFACPHCHKPPAQTPTFHQLVVHLEQARAAFYPAGLRIISGYRCPVHNAAVGGKPNSMHLQGIAADIDPVMTVQQAQRLGFRGIGYQQSSRRVVHVDMRPAPALWAYDAQGHTP